MKEIKKLDMTQSWENYSHVGSMMSIKDTIEVTLVTRNGEQYPIKVGYKNQSNYAHEGGSHKAGETVEDAWLRLGSPEISRVEVHSSGWDHSEGRETSDWDDTLWYVPEGNIEENKLKLIEQGANELISKKIGFSEFKALVRENS